MTDRAALIPRLRSVKPTLGYYAKCRDAADEIERIQKELEAYKLDAERYQWLRVPHNRVVLKVFVYEWMTFYGVALDEHIDGTRKTKDSVK